MEVEILGHVLVPIKDSHAIGGCVTCYTMELDQILWGSFDQQVRNSLIDPPLG